MTTVQCPAVAGVRHRYVQTPGLRWHVAEAGAGQHQDRPVLRREPVQHVADVGGELRIAGCRQVGQGDARLPGRDPHRLAHRDHPRPAEQRLWIAQPPQLPEHRGQRLLHRVRTVVQRDRPAPPADERREPVQERVHRPGVATLRGHHQGGELAVRCHHPRRSLPAKPRIASATSSGHCSASKWPAPGTMRTARSSACDSQPPGDVGDRCGSRSPAARSSTTWTWRSATTRASACPR